MGSTSEGTEVALPAWQRPSTRRKAAAVAGVAALVAGVGASRLAGDASADPVASDVAATCSLGGSALDVTVPVTSDDAVDPIAPGAQQVLRTDTGLPALPVEVTVNSLRVTTPIPAQVASTDSVTFEGGNMGASYEVSGASLVVTFTGPVSSSAIDTPTVVATQTIAADATGPIQWGVFSEIVADTNFGVATCTPKDPGQAVNTTEVGGGEPTTPTTPAPTTPTTPTTPVPPTEPPAEPPAEPGSPVQAEVCVDVTSPVPVPVPLPPCPITIPPAGGGAPLPIPGGGGGGGGLPLPLPGGGGLPPVPGVPEVPLPEVPLPAPGGGGGGLPLPLPGGGGGGLPLPLPLPIPDLSDPCGVIALTGIPAPCPSPPAPGGSPSPGLGLGLGVEINLGL